MTQSPSTRPGAVDVAALIDSRPLSGLQIRVVALCALVVLIDGYDIQIMSLAVPAVAEAWKIRPADFGWVLTASLAGIGLGGAFVAPLADRFGRRPLMLLGMALAGISTLAAAFSHSLTEFMVWRLITGIGIGSAQPIAAALTADFMPLRRRAWLVTLMFCNVALGAVVAGFTAPPAMAAMGWRGLFIVGAVATLGLWVVLWFALPESLRFLVARRPGHKGVAASLAHIAPEVDPANVTIAPELKVRRSVLDLLSRELRARTLVIWTIYTINVFVVYLLISWLPTLLRQAGWPADQASRGAVLFQAGGVVGGLLLSSQIDRGRATAALLFGYGLAAAAFFGLGLVAPGFWVWGGLMLLIGLGLAGAQFVLIALAAAFYPTTIRATGVGWAGTVSRIGAVAAPLFGVWAMQIATPLQVLQMMILPIAFCAALALVIRPSWRTN